MPRKMPSAFRSPDDVELEQMLLEQMALEEGARTLSEEMGGGRTMAPPPGYKSSGIIGRTMPQDMRQRLDAMELQKAIAGKLRKMPHTQW